jgi:hypothetical protein
MVTLRGPLPELERTREGWETQFATNFMGHFALTVGLHGALAAANGAPRRWSGEGIYANALNPGRHRHRPAEAHRRPENPEGLAEDGPQGAATSVLLAASPLLANVGGRYFEDCNEAAVVTRRPADYAGVAWYALDPANAERLWDTALGLVPAQVPA